MTARFEELDWRPTPLGELVLRRRLDPVTGKQIHEIKLGDEFLMSSMFTVSEVALGRLALDRLHETCPDTAWDVVNGGLGLGYTARTVLESTEVGSLVVVDALAEVIEWHERGLIPAGADLTADPRCRFMHGDFFTMARSADGLDPTEPGRRFHAIVVDIDHSPRHLLHPDNAVFYEREGLAHLSSMLHPGGVFALWSNDPPDDDFTAVLSGVLDNVAAEVVTFDNPLQQRDATATVYLAETPA